MFRKKNRKKRSRAMLSAYSIIMILIILLGILSHVLPRAEFVAITPESSEELVEPGSGNSKPELPPNVEVGPGEWEGEMPADRPEEMNLPEGESFDPEVGNDLTGENMPESRMITDGEVSADEMSTR